MRFDDGRDVQLPERYVHDGHLEHGYASTAHRAQGATVDRTFVLGADELYREWATPRSPGIANTRAST